MVAHGSGVGVGVRGSDGVDVANGLHSFPSSNGVDGVQLGGLSTAFGVDVGGIVGSGVGEGLTRISVSITDASN